MRRLHAAAAMEGSAERRGRLDAAAAATASSPNPPARAPLSSLPVTPPPPGSALRRLPGTSLPLPRRWIPVRPPTEVRGISSAGCLNDSWKLEAGESQRMNGSLYLVEQEGSKQEMKYQSLPGKRSKYAGCGRIFKFDVGELRKEQKGKKGCCKEYHPSHAIISAACALEALKLFSGCSRSVSNYLTMSHPWMYGNRCAPAFREGVNSFLLVAEANKSKQGFMCCPCLKCKNEKDYSCSRDIKSHLLRFGFMSSYNVWTKHGEEGVMMEDSDEEEDNDDQYRSMFSECDDTAMDDNEEEGGEEQVADDPVDDDLRRAISDARRDCGTDKERLQFDKMLEDHHKLLYPGCEDGHRKLGSILELLKWKAEVGVTDSGFEKLMLILKKLFPRNNELPVSTYEAKKLVAL
ncbi:hypothetical protein QYE76_020215 [Lolium multiflorum]|uniref:Transposase-associated domain-containing protein n=1 Tax=Lolium multiflorum TaxID=4521 RepID=A0AAD8R8F4_LOLMU|nr:hypothetical protein QYE76_020215 [Lolium multiflorum]